LQSDNSEALLQAALDGIGIALVPEGLAAVELRDGNCNVPFLTGRKNKKWGLCHYTTKQVNSGENLRFLDHIISRIRKQ